jgi:spore coat protein A
VLFDFSAHVGKKLILYTDVPAPFPGGDPRNDYFPGLNVNKNPVNAMTRPGYGPNTRVIMRFNVVPPTGKDAALNINKTTSLVSGNDPLLVPLGVTALPPGVPVRQLTLNEGFDEHGRLIQMLGTAVAQPGGGFGQPYSNVATEAVRAGTTEVWQIANLTADTHPIHFHLVNVQVISRQPFAVSSYAGVPNFKGAPVAPGPEERGWKETVRMNPGEVTTVIMQFNLPRVPFVVPSSNRTGGSEYVWHCHILEHEEHDMMRPLVVT